MLLGDTAGMSTPSTPYRAPEPPEPTPILVTTGMDVPGHRVAQILGVVQGFAFREAYALPSKKNAQEQLDARRKALADLVDEATELRAHAVIGVRYDSTERDFLAYGTAVRLQSL
jgi:uncharacterized protein YbjQ (UPF0145 family)